MRRPNSPWTVARELIDLSSERFEARPAPAEALRWIGPTPFSE